VDRAQKQRLVDSLRRDLEDVACLVVTHQSGLDVAEATRLRRQVRSAGACFRVTKNRLARRALTGGPFEGLSPLFTGPTAIAFSRDPVAAAKVVVDFANRTTKLTIVGGGLAGVAMDSAGVKELADLPALDELRSALIGLLTAPARRLATVLQVPAGQLARVLAAHAETAPPAQDTTHPGNLGAEHAGSGTTGG
jgi:large subunit ribosomal protein L10